MQHDVGALIERVYTARRGANPGHASVFATEALELARGQPDQEQLVRALMAKGQCCRDDRQFTAAEKFYVEAANLCRREPVDRLVTAHVIRHLGDVAAELGRFGMARTHYEEALDLYRELEDLPPRTLANALRPLARLLDLLDDHAEALELWREARDLYAAAHVHAAEEECERRLNGAG